MYFNGNKSNTSIDKEFQNNNNILSRIIEKLNKYKLFISIYIIVIILIILMIILFTNRKIEYQLDLIGENNITLYQGSNYIEPGYEASNSKDEDLTNKVIIKSSLDINKPGDYVIEYKIGDITKTRIITVIEKPEEYTYIYLKSVDNDINIYLELNEKYVEPGYQAFNTSGEDLTDKVKVSGEVNTSKRGTYKLVYSIIDASGVTISAERIITVMDAEINLTLSPTSYTNKDVTIKINILDDYFDYIVLPDKNKETKKSFTYTVSENGTYKFTTHNKKGMVKEETIEVKIIDKVSPTVSCKGSYKEGKSTINVTGNDNVGISKYVINGTEYKTSETKIQKTLSGELETVSVTIYDKAGNSKTFSCNLDDKNEVIISDKSITFSYEYVKDQDYMPYALYTPSTANTNKDIPLIVWLHGSGSVGKGEAGLKNSGLLYTLDKWSLDGFNAYVLCPQLSSGENWKYAAEKYNNVLDKVVNEKNIDKNKIILTGHSLGGIGVLYLAYYRKDYYSALVVLSGYNPGVDYSTLKNMPIKGYTERGLSFMINNFANTFGTDKLTIFNVDHGIVPKAAFTEDKNNDNKSDLIEWMLRQSK